MILRLLVILLLSQAISWWLLTTVLFFEGVQFIWASVIISSVLSLLGLWFIVFRPNFRGIQQLEKILGSTTLLHEQQRQKLPVELRNLGYGLQKFMQASHNNTKNEQYALEQSQQSILSLPFAILMGNRSGIITRMSRQALNQFPELKLGELIPWQQELSKMYQQNSTQNITLENAGSVSICLGLPQAEEQAWMAIFVPEKKSNNTKKLLADLSHELRTPLSSVKGFIETLRTQKTAKDQREKIYKTIAKQTLRMESLLNDLTVLSQLDQENFILDQIVDLTQLIPEEVNALLPMIQKHKTRIVFDWQEEALVLGNERRLAQLVCNLLQNALKYNPKQTEVTLRLIKQQGKELSLQYPELGELSENQTYWSFIVKDTGVGIAPQHLAHLCDRFYRVDRHRSFQDGGSGLGLAIVKQVVRNHHGFLAIRSELGKGSSFEVILPMLPEENMEA